MNELLKLIAIYAQIYSIDPKLVQSIVQIESGYDANAIGELGEIGLLQLRPEYFTLPIKELRKPKTNLRLGIAHLSEARSQCVHKIDYTWIVCYNHGVAGGNKIRFPKQDKYYKKIIENYRRLNAH